MSSPAERVKMEDARAPLRNALSVDVEEYFQVSALAPAVPRSSWEQRPSRVEASVDALLELFARHDARATFFTLGWVAERRPGLVRRVVDAGHELASHGYAHDRVTSFTRETFREDLTRAKGILEDIGGVAVRGYRAPSFSIDATTPWALETIRETGHVYSSSIYPIQHDHYGMPDAPRWPYQPLDGEAFWELPVATARLMNRNLPAAGGGYFRLLPYFWSKRLLRRINQVDEKPAIFYFHPWEIDPDQPRVGGLPLKSRFRHYVNLAHMKDRLDRLLGDFRWDRIDRVFLESAP